MIANALHCKRKKKGEKEKLLENKQFCPLTAV
jgi:hypothetical protein